MMKPTIRKITSDVFRLVEVYGVTGTFFSADSSSILILLVDIRVLALDQDILQVIDSWPEADRESTRLKLVFKDPSRMKKVLRIFLEGDMTKALAVGYDMTAAGVCSMLAQKMKLMDTTKYRLILVTDHNENRDRVVDSEENVFALVSILDQRKSPYHFYFRDPLMPIRKGDMEVISIAYSIPELPRFEVISLLGQGGFGKVWKVRDTVNDQIVALKVMRKHLVVEREMILHTNVELQMLRDLSHPFIVRLFHSEQSEERLYLAMEHLEGGSLFDLIRTSHGPFTVRSPLLWVVWSF
jgi:hypothetical protein